MTSESDATATLVDLTTGLYAYLTEVDAYGVICRRHRGRVLVGDDGDVAVIRSFQETEKALAHLQIALTTMPPCPVGPAKGKSPRRPQTCGWWTSKEVITSVLQRTILWEGRRCSVHVWRIEPCSVLNVAVVLRPFGGDVPELPLRKVAIALRCHEALVPLTVAEASIVDPIRPLLAMEDYLRRAMPSNLWASQCFPLQGAGN
jgi:hypothetical protein